MVVTYRSPLTAMAAPVLFMVPSAQRPHIEPLGVHIVRWIATVPQRVSWVRMVLARAAVSVRVLNDAQTFIRVAPSLALWPGLAIALAVLGFNLLGDGLRDALDPRLEVRRT